ncbi:hypothetical protein [Rhizorhabdus argentea]|uniref:hypothetical protein n=1 Tax=Rhizorhabdus argentea TaxID=1387174 RepID=UPI0030EF12EB
MARLFGGAGASVAGFDVSDAAPDAFRLMSRPKLAARAIACDFLPLFRRIGMAPSRRITSPSNIRLRLMLSTMSVDAVRTHGALS